MKASSGMYISGGRSERSSHADSLAKRSSRSGYHGRNALVGQRPPHYPHLQTSVRSYFGSSILAQAYPAFILPATLLSAIPAQSVPIMMTSMPAQSIPALVEPDHDRERNR